MTSAGYSGDRKLDVATAKMENGNAMWSISYIARVAEA
jgi:hypothetical protein